VGETVSPSYASSSSTSIARGARPRPSPVGLLVKIIRPRPQGAGARAPLKGTSGRGRDAKLATRDTLRSRQTRKAKPREAAATGASRLRSRVKRDDPSPCERITTSPPTACHGHHCAMQNQLAKKRAPRGD